MRNYIAWLALALSLTVAAYGANETADMTRTLGGKPVVAISPEDYVLLIHTTAQTSKQVRRVKANQIPIIHDQMTSALRNNVITTQGVNTTTPDGGRGVECYNTGDFSTTGFTPAKAGTFCYNQTLGKFRYWDGATLRDWSGGATATTELTDWPLTVSIAELAFLDGLSGNVQTRLTALESVVGGTGGDGRVAVPPYNDSPCTVNDWAEDANARYKCVATNTWQKFAFTYAAWDSPSPPASYTLFASQSTLSPTQVGVNDITDRARVGAIVDSATPHSVRRLKVYIRAVTDGGALAAKNYIAKLYALDGSKTLSTLLATSSNTISGADILASSWLTFDFPTTTLAQGNAWVIQEASGAAPDAANYIMIGYNAADSDSTYNHYATWRTNGTLYAEQPTRDLRYELYE